MGGFFWKIRDIMYRYNDNINTYSEIIKIKYILFTLGNHCRYLYTVTVLESHCPTKRLFSSSTHTPRGDVIPCCDESIMDRNPPS